MVGIVIHCDVQQSIHFVLVTDMSSRDLAAALQVEGKDAQYLAQVMQFKKEKAEAGLSSWQVSGYKGVGVC